jgi:hypothetical protein
MNRRSIFSKALGGIAALTLGRFASHPREAAAAPTATGPAPTLPRGLYEVTTVGGVGIIGREASGAVAFQITIAGDCYQRGLNDDLRALLDRIDPPIETESPEAVAAWWALAPRSVAR